MNYTTKRHPRTLEEAFGPGHRGGLFEERTPMDTADKVVVCVGLAIIVGLLIAIVRGVI